MVRNLSNFRFFCDFPLQICGKILNGDVLFSVGFRNNLLFHRWLFCKHGFRELKYWFIKVQNPFFMWEVWVKYIILPSYETVLSFIWISFPSRYSDISHILCNSVTENNSWLPILPLHKSIKPEFTVSSWFIIFWINSGLWINFTCSLIANCLVEQTYTTSSLNFFLWYSDISKLLKFFL